MYRYDEFDKNFVAARVAQFRDQVARRLSGELDEEQFRPLRLMNGVYLQLHAYMLRIAIPYGTLSSRQLRKLAFIARRYDKGYGHFTTRQNIQFNWPALKDCPDILNELAEVEMHAIQTSGNCIRNVTADQFAGAAADEIEDPRPYAEILRQWSSLHPEYSFLPRKFKIAVNGAAKDRAAIRVHDIGYQIVKNAEGEVGFAVYVGGGLGRTPLIAHKIRDFLPKADLLAYTNAILRIYNLEGRRDNKFKARIKILVHEKGADVIARRGRGRVRRSSRRRARPAARRNRSHPRLFRATGIARARSHFHCVRKTKSKRSRVCPFRFAKRGGAQNAGIWDRHDLPKTHRRHSRRRQRRIHGNDRRSRRSDFRKTRSASRMNKTSSCRMSRSMICPRCSTGLPSQGLATANTGLVTDIIACPGLDYCGLATARSIPVAQRISERFGNGARAREIGELKINISGCINACGHHHVGHIGILGLEKSGSEAYQITLGGSADETCNVGAITGRSFSSDEIVDAIETVVDTYLKFRAGSAEDFLAAYRRIGMEPFKEALYGRE